MNKFISIVLLVGAVAVGAGVVFTHDRMSQTTEQGTGNLYAVSEDIHNLRQLDGEWSLSVLRALVSDTDFDEVAGFLPRLRELRDSLSTAADAEESIPDNLKNRLFRFLSLIESKEQTVEQFKTNFAVVRNSRKFLPVATRSLINSANELDKVVAEGGAEPSTAGAELANVIRSINDRVSSFSQRPDEGAKVRVLTTLSEFEEQVIQYPPEMTNALNNYISHSRIIMERTIPLNGILKRVLGTEVAEAGTELSAQFRNFSDSLVAEVDAGTASHNQQLLMMIMALCAVAIIAGVMYTINAFSFDKKMKSSVAKATEKLEKELESSNSNANAAGDVGSVSSMASTIASELGNPVSKLSESLEAIRASATGFDTLKVEVDKFMNAKSQDTFELMNNLKSIGDVLDSVRGDSTLNDVPEALDEMEHNIQQVQAFAGELRNLSNTELKPKAMFNVNETVEASIEEAQSSLPSNVTVKSKLGTAPEIFGSSEEMQSTIVSLIHNAAEAIKDSDNAKGQIMVSTKKHNDRIIISVVDNGKGMDDETRSRVFEPFFTTKERGGKVSGLGLSVAQKMVMHNEGKIVIKSIPGKGSNFSVVLPIKSKQQEAV